MPVSAWIGAGIAAPGFTSVDHSELASKPSTSITPISVMRYHAGWLPVVSRSTTASGLSRSYVTAFLYSIPRHYAGSSRHWHVPRLDPDPVQPGSHRWVGRKVEAAVAGAMGVRVERDVGDGVARAGEERLALELALHDRQPRPTALAQPRQLGATRPVRRLLARDRAAHTT